MGHEDAFPRPRLSAPCRFSQGTFAGTRAHPAGAPWRIARPPRRPYHAPTFVLTHYPRDPIEMDGGTTFIFVTDGIEAALEKARLAAGGCDVKIGGGVETVRQYLRADLIDELHFALSPVVLGQGEPMFAGIDLPALGYRVTEHQATEHATHIVLSR